MIVDAILPAAGLATRLRGLPKFLLPCDADYLTLIERHINGLLEFCRTIWIPTRPEQIILLESLGISSDRVVIIPLTTATMTESVMRVGRLSAADRFVVVMPDTFFYGDQPYKFLSASDSYLSLACWQIRPDQIGKLGQVHVQDLGGRRVAVAARDKDMSCEFPHFWGAMSFSPQALEIAKKDMPHTGYLIPEAIALNFEIPVQVMQGQYFDCGTTSEYASMVQAVF